MDENLQHPQDLRRCFVIGNDEPKFSLLCSGLFRNLEPALVSRIYIYIYTYTNTFASTASIYLIFIYLVNLVIVFFVVISLYIFIEFYGSVGLLYIWLCTSPPASR